MIKFFRKIRQKMLTENKFSKYLIYAIGEIILVVIGILIALSINTWNERRVNNIKTIKGRNIQKDQYLRKQWVIKTLDEIHKNAKNLISEIQKY